MSAAEAPAEGNTWNEDRIKRTVELWQAGLPPGEIAYDVGMTKNAVCGLVFRLRKRGVDLAVRGSPIGLDKAEHLGNRLANGSLGAAALPGKLPKAYVPRPPRPRPEAAPAPRPAAPRPSPAIAGNLAPLVRRPTPAKPAPPSSIHRTCRMIPKDDVGPWVVEQPKFCGAPVLTGRSWCPACAVRVFDRRAVAA